MGLGIDNELHVSLKLLDILRFRSSFDDLMSLAGDEYNDESESDDCDEDEDFSMTANTSSLMRTRVLASNMLAISDEVEEALEALAWPLNRCDVTSELSGGGGELLAIYRFSYKRLESSLLLASLMVIFGSVNLNARKLLVSNEKSAGIEALRILFSRS